MSQYMAEAKSIKAKPQQMFQSILQEKLGVSSLSELNGATTSASQVQSEVKAYDTAAQTQTATGNYCLICGEPEMTTTASAYSQYGATNTVYFEKAQPYMDYIYEASQTYGMPVNLILGIIKAESDFNNDCVSYAGAKGLMQLMPETAAEVGVTDVFDPRQNILGGVEYVTKLINRYNGDVKLALAAYNTGPGKIAQRGVTSSNSAEYLTVPQSIRDYADRVLRYAGYPEGSI